MPSSMIDTPPQLATQLATQLTRQVAHWTSAAERLRDLDELASPAAWQGLEQYLGVAVRQRLAQSTERLVRQGARLRSSLSAAQNGAQLKRVRLELLSFRAQYLRTETTLEFYADAVNTRTNPATAALLRACDTLAYRSMAQLLDPLGKPTPVALTYLDKGLGASILKAGLRLWDGSTESPAATIKVVRHNLLRPTSLIHEAGHQVAHITNWNDELALTLEAGLADAPPFVAKAWASWASEIAADAFAFVHTGYASVASLHDVLAGGPSFVFRFMPGDPHPISYVRVLLGVAMCRRFYGAGPWDELERSWLAHYPLNRAPSDTVALLRASAPLLPRVAELTLSTPATAFGGRPLAALIDPERVSPSTLGRLEQQLGPALYTSAHWVWTESLRLLALTGLNVVLRPDDAPKIFKQQRDWMLRLGSTLQAA